MSNKIKIPYIKLQQRSEVFFVTKMSVEFLKKHVNLHFRDPYMHNQPEDYIEKYEDYIENIRRKGLELATDNNEGVQRRLQIRRIEGIRKYIEEKTSNFFPNSILVSADIGENEEFEKKYLEYEANEHGFFEFDENIRFSVIDGQHRLAGLFLTESVEIQEFELPVILLFNVSLPTASKLFADINGKQKPVSKSLIYDLYQNVTDNDFREIRIYNQICQQFYNDEKSPLFRQIKMLGTGSGAISQSFFIDMAVKNIPFELYTLGSQEIYNQLFYFYKSFQKLFPEDWPVPVSFNNVREVDNHAKTVLKEYKSQLVKTNGFGAIMRIFTEAYEKSGGNFDGYINVTSKFVGRIKWKRDEIDQAGGGSAMQTYLYRQLLDCLK